MNRLTFGIVFLLLACVTCFGQTSYKGLTPGQSTRADVDRVLGQAVKSISPTLSEYKESNNDGIDKVYVQFRDRSAFAVIERIELVCDYSGRSANRPNGCGRLSAQLKERGITGRLYARKFERETSGVIKRTFQNGPPAFTVHIWRKDSNDNESVQDRLGLYSLELFDSAVPKSCTGTFLGVWETNRGRLVLSDIPGSLKEDPAIPNTKGTYSTGNGTLTGFEGLKSLTGEWKDATGSGTFELRFNLPPFNLPPPDAVRTFTGTWRRTSGSGLKEGVWEGRCVETN